MITLKNTKRNYEINLPTSFSEINFDAIVDVVKNVNVSEHYVVVALCQSFSPFNLAMLGTKGKDFNVPVSVNFIKANDPNHKVDAKPGDKVIINRSDIEMATHLPIRFGLSQASISATIEDCPEMRTYLRNLTNDDSGKPVKELVAVEFKLMPLSAIKAVIKRDVAITDIYKTTIQGS